MKSLIFKTTAVVLSSALLFSFNAFSNQKLDQLLNKVMEERSEESQLWKEREAEFTKEKSQQAALVAKAKSELKALENVGTQLSKTYEANEGQLQELEEAKRVVMGAFGELYGVVRQMAGDFYTQILNSPTSAEKHARKAELQKLAQTKTLPTYDQLENFWFILQEEMTLQAQTQSFKAAVTNVKGISEERTVNRVGAFSLFVDNEFVNYDGRSNNIEVYPRQPEGRYTRSLKGFAKADPGTVALVSFDPSKGALLETLIQAPNLMERYHQGGLVGYIITFLLLIGLAVSAERLYFYSRQEKLMLKQLDNKSNPDLSNPLGVLIQTFNEYKNAEDPSVVSLKLSEVVLNAKPKFQRGLSTIKTFAAVAPLLGLLGTVTGMILTFQSITMFGSGDPKLMAGGISQALITTVQGLTCAIPLLLVHSYVNGKYQATMTFLNEQLAGLLAESEEKK